MPRNRFEREFYGFLKSNDLYDSFKHATEENHKISFNMYLKRTYPDQWISNAFSWAGRVTREDIDDRATVRTWSRISILWIERLNELIKHENEN